MEETITVTMSKKVFKERFEENPDYADKIVYLRSINGKLLGITILEVD